MPIWLRKFTFESIKNWYDEERKAKEEKNLIEDKKEYKKPNIDTNAASTRKIKSPIEPYLTRIPTAKK